TPVANPGVQEFRTRCFHELKTTSARRIHPTRVVDDAFRQHSTASLEPFAHQPRMAMFEAFNNHEQHVGKSTSLGPNIKLPRRPDEGYRPAPTPFQRQL